MLATYQAQYRASTPPNSSQSASADTPSPKRKRPNARSPPALQIDALRNLDDAGESGAESPRSKVAERLRGLDLRESTQQQRPRSPHPRKRLKRHPGLRDSSDDDADFLASTELPAAQLGESQSRWTPSGLAEIPDSDPAVLPSPPSPRVVTDLTPPRSPPRPDTAESKLPNLQTQPSPPGPAASLMTPTRSSPPLSPPSTLSPLESLTWHPNEITGHLPSTSTPDPDDDGTGLNGIGFHPTPALAWARSEKRRQQVRDWKAREAREARSRRVAKRRGQAEEGEMAGKEGTGRAVRFVGD